MRSGERFILVGFYNADGRDRAGEEQFFGKKAREEGRLRTPVPPPVQTIYFTTAVASLRAGTGANGSNGQAASACRALLRRCNSRSDCSHELVIRRLARLYCQRNMTQRPRRASAPN